MTPFTDSGIQCHLFTYLYVVNQAAPPNRGQCISDFFLTREEGTCICNGNSVSKIRHNLKLNFDFIIWNWGDVILNVNADFKKKILKFVFPKFKSLNYFIELNNKTGSYVVLSEIHKLLILNQVKLFKFNLWKTTLNLRR